MEGKKIANLDAGKQKGINVVNWSFRSKAPKIAKGKTFSFDGFNAPRVPAGTYRVVMKKGKEEFVHPIEVVYDPKSDISLTDRRKQEELTRELFDLTQDLAYLVYQVDSYLEQIEKVKSADPKSAKALNPIALELNKLKETLVITTGDNYVGTAEPQLRERISKLYGVVVSNFEAPSPAQFELKNDFTEILAQSHSKFGALKSKHGKTLEKSASNAGVPALAIDDFNSFLEK